MNNPTLIIYDNETGRVWHIQNGVEEIPSGMEDCAIIADAPEGFDSVTIDLANRTASFTLGEYERQKAQIYYTAMMTDTLIEED